MMNLLEILLIGVSLSMDALAVSVALGTLERNAFTWRKIFITALFFGLFQALMPLAGWFGGTLCGDTVQNYGRIIAAVLLCGIGGKMIKDRNQEERPEFGFLPLVMLAFATSIDALLVGVGFACLGRTDIGLDITVIGLTTLVISAAGCVVGRCCGNIFGNKCEILGGLVLIGIGIKVLIWG